MLRVLPSQVVGVIDKVFPEVAKAVPPSDDFAFGPGLAEHVSVILGVIELIPDELITLDSDDAAAFAASISSLKVAFEMWRGPYGNSYRQGGPVPGFTSHPLLLIRETLTRCPDEVPAASTNELQFIIDIELRTALRLDISTSHSALRNGEWKPATVIADSVVEALLLWALQQLPLATVTSSATRLVANSGLASSPHGDILRWTLEQYIAVAKDLNVITQPTAMQCKIAQEFRNLIHPGRAQRLQSKCTRGTAHSAVGAMEQVIEDLS